MKASKFILLLLLSLAGMSSAGAHGGRVGVGVHVGSPYWGPSYYPHHYYYPPPVVVVPAPIYVEQNPPPTAAPTQQYWYYCASAKGYYPYVSECSDGWQTVLPQPTR